MVKFTHVGKATKFITKLLKSSSLKISLKTDDTIGKLLTNNKVYNSNKFNKCGICQLTCPD